MILGEVIFLDNQMNEFICFADFEFTCGLPVTKGKSEMLSVGIVICDISMNIAETFYSTSKPNHFPKLTKRCIEITHLSQDEINASQDSQIVLEKVIGLLKKYSVSSLYVWGNFDKTGLQCDALMHRKHELKSDAILKISQKIIDIQPSLTKEMGLPYAINIKDLSSVFGYVPESGTYHNALNDAIMLCEIDKNIYRFLSPKDLYNVWKDGKENTFSKNTFTKASKNNWTLKAEFKNYVKYFNDYETAIYWLAKYKFIKIDSIENIDFPTIIGNIKSATQKGQKAYGMYWYAN